MAKLKDNTSHSLAFYRDLTFCLNVFKGFDICCFDPFRWPFKWLIHSTIWRKKLFQRKVHGHHKQLSYHIWMCVCVFLVNIFANLLFILFLFEIQCQEKQKKMIQDNYNKKNELIMLKIAHDMNNRIEKKIEENVQIGIEKKRNSNLSNNRQSAIEKKVLLSFCPLKKLQLAKFYTFIALFNSKYVSFYLYCESFFLCVPLFFNVLTISMTSTFFSPVKLLFCTIVSRVFVWNVIRFFSVRKKESKK